jgi:hypothetical protein
MYIAEKLHKTLGEIGEMPNEEFGRWVVWFARKNQIAEMEAKKAGG